MEAFARKKGRAAVLTTILFSLYFGNVHKIVYTCARRNVLYSLKLFFFTESILSYITKLLIFLFYSTLRFQTLHESYLFTFSLHYFTLCVCGCNSLSYICKVERGKALSQKPTKKRLAQSSKLLPALGCTAQMCPLVKNVNWLYICLCRLFSLPVHYVVSGLTSE